MYCGSTRAAEQEDPSASKFEDQPLEEVVVTGTRIKRRDFSSPSPLVTVTDETFEFSGQPTLEETLNQMPQFQPHFGRTSNNPGDGTALLNLRGLGPGRTLVLLNGRRLAPTGVGSAVDVNSLPESLIERVEIITGGTSAVYGSDAIAGVVNFITHENFEGLGVDAGYTVTSEGDAEIYDANLTYGHNKADGTGNITFYAGYYERKPLLAGQRKHSEVMMRESPFNPGELIEVGTVTGPDGVIFGSSFLTWDSDGNPRDYDFSRDLWNPQPNNYLQTGLTRHTAGIMGRLEISDSMEIYVEAGFARNEADLQIAPVPAEGFFVVNTDNPVLTAATQELFEDEFLIDENTAGFFFGRRLVELEPRQSTFERDESRIVAGIRGEFGQGWEFDGWLTWADGSETERLSNYASRSRFQQGLLVDPATGQCFDPTGGCVALDVFGAGRMSAAGAEFLRLAPLHNAADRKQQMANIVVTGTPFEWRPGPISMSFGAEWRRDEGRFRADDLLFDDDVLGTFGSSPVDGIERVWELYSEALIPLIGDGATGQTMTAELGLRYSNYNLAGSAWTWKAGLQWQPSDWLWFRAMSSRSVRAPNLEELFTQPFTVGGIFVDAFYGDPCSASEDPVANGVVDKCLIQGLTQEQIGVFEAVPFYPVDYILGGNPNLVPEESDTLTLGVVITPASMPGLILTVDYFDIEVTGTIGGISPDEICFDPINTGNVFCDNIHRDSTGNVSRVFAPESNRGLLRSDGIDTQVQYTTELPASMALFSGNAQLSLELIWTYLLSWQDQENIVTQVLECAGLFSGDCEGAVSVTYPEHRVFSAASYQSGPLTAQLAWRWIDGTRNFASQDPENILAITSVSSYSYFDFGAAYQFSDSWQARIGVNNLLDEDPPQMANWAWANNTDTGYYDVFGRTYYLSVQWNSVR